MLSDTAILIGSDLLRKAADKFIGILMDFTVYRIAAGQSQPANEIILHELGILIGHTATLVCLAAIFAVVEEINLWLGLIFVGAALSAPLALFQLRSPVYRKITKE